MDDAYFEEKAVTLGNHHEPPELEQLRAQLDSIAETIGFKGPRGEVHSALYAKVMGDQLKLKTAAEDVLLAMGHTLEWWEAEAQRLLCAAPMTLEEWLKCPPGWYKSDVKPPEKLPWLLPERILPLVKALRTLFG